MDAKYLIWSFKSLLFMFSLFCSAGDRCYLKGFPARAQPQFKSVERGLSGYVSCD